MVNYVEGAAYLEGQPLGTKDAGNAVLQAGQELRTGNGRVEVLLTPGVFLRVDSNSTIKMVSPDLTRTQVEVEKGRAGVEVDELHDQNNLQVIDAGVTTRLDKKGYYEFDADNAKAMVFKGKATVELANEKNRDIKEHHELALAGTADMAKVKPADFDTHASDDLYNWSSLRSQYLAEANNKVVAEYADGGYYPGWYWNPYGWGYTFIGGGPFYSPFGWGFYPLGWGGGWYGGWVGRPYYGHGYYRHPYAGAPRGGFHTGAANGFHGGTVGGFHGGSVGGFHGGSMGGFHGGSMGGFHGGAMGGRR